MKNNHKEQSKSTNRTQMADMLENLISGVEADLPQNNIPVEFFTILFEKFYNYFYENNKGFQGEPVFKRITEVSAIKVEFEDGIKYHYSKKDKSGKKYRIIVLPNKGSELEKKQEVNQMIKEFDCLETLGLYQLLLSIINSYLYHPKNLIEFIHRCDPKPSENVSEVYEKLFRWLVKKGQQLNGNSKTKK